MIIMRFKYWTYYVVCCIIISVKGKRPEVNFKEVYIMLYNIWFNGEMISTEVSFMGACLYLSEHCLMVCEEDENLEQDNWYVNLYCVED